MMRASRPRQEISRVPPRRRNLVVAALLCAALVMPGTALQAQALPQLLSKALEADPLLAQGAADLASAEARRKSARAEHLPRMAVEGASTVTGDAPDIDPELIGSVNLWSGGGIEAQVRSATHEARRFEARLLETRENLAYEVSRLYLDALRLEEQLAVSRHNLQRHDKIVGNLDIVVSHDAGRRYDLVQAQTRRAQVASRILTLESELDAAQARLTRYTSEARTELLPLKINTQPADAAVLAEHPSYRTQAEDLGSAGAQVDVARARRWPRVDVQSVFTEQAATRIALNWDAFNFGTGDSIDAARQREASSLALLAAVGRDLDVQRKAAQVNYQRSEARLRSARALIGSQQGVAEVFEKQFQIARRSMVDLLNAYAELSSVEAAAAQAQSDRRSFALEYLRASARTEAGVRASTAPDDELLLPSAVPSDAELPERSDVDEPAATAETPPQVPAQ